MDSANDSVVPNEEQNAEQEALTEVKTDELRSKVAEELGIDPNEQSDILDRVVEMRQKDHKALSDAIRQKRSWRDKASKLPKDQATQNGKPITSETPDIDKIIEQKLEERLSAEELKRLELSDELKAEVKDLAKLKGISIREASAHPYIKSMIEEAKKKERILRATPTRTGKGSYVSTVDPAKPLDPADFDLSTVEGRKAWEEAKGARRNHRNQNG